MSKFYEFENDLHPIIVDYKQTYSVYCSGRVDREKLWKALVILETPEKYVNLIKKMLWKNIMQSALFARYLRYFWN